MKKDIITYIPIGILTGATLVSGAALAGSGAFAAASCSQNNTTGVWTCTDTATASVTVSNACSIAQTSATSSVSETSMTADGGTVTNSQSLTKPEYQATCNDSGGLSIYAVGNSPATAGGAQTQGQTHLIGTNGAINTGINTTGNSSWAMKVTTATSNNTSSPATIQGGYNTYNVVPSTYTEIVRAAGRSDQNTTLDLRVDYQVYASSVQPAGTYTGAVKYTVTHPTGTAPSA